MSDILARLPLGMISKDGVSPLRTVRSIQRFNASRRTRTTLVDRSPTLRWAGSPSRRARLEPGRTRSDKDFVVTWKAIAGGLADAVAAMHSADTNPIVL